MDTAVTPLYLQNLLAGTVALPQSPLSWLNRLRAEAVDRVGALTVPTTREEAWRFTDLSALARISFQPASRHSSLRHSDFEPYYLPEAAARLVFVDGVHVPELSTTAVKEILFQDLRVLDHHSADPRLNGTVLQQYLGQSVEFRNDVFIALNTAFLHDGAFIIIPDGIRLQSPLHLLFVATQPTAIYPRCLVVMGSHSAATVIEDYVGLTDQTYLNNAVTEISVGDHARLEHVRVQRDSANAFHIANCGVSLARAADYRSSAVTLGAMISRYNFDLKQAADGAQGVIDGLVLIGGTQLADVHSRVEHAHAHGTSRQLHKCIVGGDAHAVFDGKIVVQRGAQLTDSAQSSRNLLLSSRAHVDIKPQLEIFADDVKCAHGATVGQLEDDEFFYLQSRGLHEVAARNLLTYAFGAEVIERIPIPSLRRILEERVFALSAAQP